MYNPLPIRLREDDLLLFLHIPRTAAASFAAVMESHFPPDRIFPLYSAPLDALFEAYTPAQYARFQLVRGHFCRFGPFDKHVYRYLGPNPFLLTILRDPVARTLSVYRHVQRRTRHKRHREVAGNGMSFLEFIDHPPFHIKIRNRMTLLLVGACCPEPEKLPPTVALALAKERLQQMAFFGLAEQFAASMKLLARTFGWEPKTEMPELDSEPHRSDRADLSEAEVSAVSAQLDLDLELYEFASGLFAERLARWLPEAVAATAGARPPIQPALA